CVIQSTFLQHYSLLFVFFFSSRRRHTRSKRDWSSDVCSSDLPKVTPKSANADPSEFSEKSIADKSVTPKRILNKVVNTIPTKIRSEERRVGKEGRTRWEAYPCRKEK